MPRPLSVDDIQVFRDDLSRVAARLFAEHRLAGVTMRAVAAELGVSPMTPYRYSKNKDEILETVRADGFRRFGARIASAGARHRCPIERFRAISGAYLAFAQDEPDVYRIMFTLDIHDAELDPLHHAELGTGWQVLRDTMEEGVRGGLLHGDPATVAHLAWLPLHGLMTLHLADKPRLGRSLEELAEPSIEHLLRGAAARPARSRSSGGAACAGGPS